MSASCSGMLTLSADAARFGFSGRILSMRLRELAEAFVRQKNARETTEWQRQYSCLLSLGMLQKRHRGRFVNEG